MTGKYTRVSIAFAALLLCTLLAVLEGCGRPNTAVPRDKVENKESAALFWVNGEAVSGSVFDRFVEENITGAGYHGGAVDRDSEDFMKFVDSFLIYRAALKAGDRLGVARDPFFSHAKKTVHLALLGRAFFREMVATASIEPDEIASRIPDPWVEMTFRLKVFNNMEEAKKAREGIKKPSDFDSYKGAVVLNTRGRDSSFTDPLFKGSGFFEPFDDAYLFSLEEGEISRPVVSGLGPALALVVKRHDFSPEEQEAYLEKVRRELSGKRAVGELQDLEGKVGLTVLEDALQRSIKEELFGYPPSERIILRVGSFDVSYREFRYLAKINLSELVRGVPESTIGGIISPEVRAFGQNVLLGLQGEKEGFRPVGRTVVEVPEGQVVRRIRYEQSLRLLMNSLDVEIPDSDEIETFYRSNPESFKKPKGVRFAYYFTTERNDLERILNQYRDGLPFDRLRTTPPAGMPDHGKGARMQSVFTRDGDGLFKDIKDRLYAMKSGEVKIIRGGMGYYLVQVKEVIPEGRIPIDVVKNEIKSRLIQERRKDAARQYLKDAVKKMKVDMNDPSLRENVPPPIEHPETGRLQGPGPGGLWGRVDFGVFEDGFQPVDTG